MRIFLLLSVLFLCSEARDREKNLKTPYAKDTLPALSSDAATVYFSDEFAQNALCRALYCRDKEVCLVYKDNTATCIKEKSWRKTSSKKKSKNSRKKSVLTEAPRNDCPVCPVVHPTFVCGSDNVTYSSECRLQYKNCEDKTNVAVACQGRCPCRTDEANSMLDLTEITTTRPLKKHEMRAQGLLGERTENDLDNHVAVAPRRKSVSSEKKQGCSKKEMKEMRLRLNDWFKAVFRQKVEEGEPADFVQNPVCTWGYNHALLSWVFLFFDENKDSSLTMTELFELEADKYEHCINPFLEYCDADRDLEISGSEWCRCFQDKMAKRFKPSEMRKSADII